MLEMSIPNIPLALYIHIPWCVRKCPYCDFNSHTLKEDTDFAQYTDALIADINSQLHLVQNRPITSIFIGGGTPSLLPVAQYKRMFDHLQNVLTLAEDIEITLEANPGTVEHAPFADYLEVGINRLSLGVQTFSADKLVRLGRIHDPNQAITAIQNAKDAGFERINVDLMHGLPEQTADEAVADIDVAMGAGATHLSWYQLTIEPNTVFYRDTPILPDEHRLADIEEQGRAVLEQAGFRNYEISAWVGQNDLPCRHNVNYWQFGDYLAIGAGGHGKVSLKEVMGLEDGIYRYSKSRLPKDYLNFDNHPKSVNFQVIANDELTSEFMLNALRLTDGFESRLFSERTGLDLSDIKPILDKLQSQELLIYDEKRIQPTLLGRQYLNQVMQAFI